MCTVILTMVNALPSSNWLLLEAMERIGFIPDLLHVHDLPHSHDSLLVKKKSTIGFRHIKESEQF